MSEYIANYHVGSASIDVPYSHYKHGITLAEFGGASSKTSLAMVYHSRYREAADNYFSMVPGMKLNLQKKILWDSNYTRASLIESDGSQTQYAGEGPLLAEDNSGRELIRNADGTAVLIGGTDIVEEYNAAGNITAVKRRMQGVSFSTLLSYTYDSNNRLEWIVDRMGRRIRITYNASGVVNALTVMSSTLSVKWSATIAYSGSNVTLSLCTGVDVQYNINSNQFTVFTLPHAGTYSHFCEKYICTANSNIITIQKLCGTRTEVNTSYTYLFYDGYEQGGLIEEKDRFGVRRRYQCKGGHLEYRYEVAGIEDDEDSAFYTATQAIDQPYKCDVSIHKRHSLTGAILQEPFFVKTSSITNKFAFTIPSGFLKTTALNYFTVSGWLKCYEAPVTIQVKPEIGPCFYEQTIPGVAHNYWRFFCYDLAFIPQDGNSYLEIIVSLPESLPTNAEIRDVRLTPVSEEIAAKKEILVKKTSPTTVIPLEDIKMVIYQQDGIEKERLCSVFYGDINKRFYNEAIEDGRNNLYLEDCFEVHPNCTNIQIGFEENGAAVYKPLNDYYIGTLTVSGEKTIQQYIMYNESANVFKTVYTVIKIGSNQKTVVEKYNINGLLLEQSDGTTTTTYTRTAHGLVLSKRISATGSTNVMEETFTYDSNEDLLLSHTNTDGTVTAFETDDFWGVQTKVTLPDALQQVITYDNCMSIPTKITFSKTGVSDTLRTNFSYSDGAVSALYQGDLKFTFTHTNGQLTEVGKGSPVSTSVIRGFQYESDGRKVTEYVPTTDPNNPSYRNGTLVDKYGRPIRHCFNNIEKLKLAYANEMRYAVEMEGDNDYNNSSARLRVVQDTVTGEETTYQHDYQGHVTTATATTSSGSTVRTETPTYDAIGRLTSSECTYANAPVSQTKTVITYVDGENVPMADNRPATIAYSANSVQQLTDTLTYDSFKRVTQLSQEMYALTVNNIYTYSSGNGKTSHRVSNAQVKTGTTAQHNVHYGYDGCGRLTSAVDRTVLGSNVTYAYDAFGRLVRENNQALNATYVYAYDLSGNLISIQKYAYTTGETLPATYTETVLTYGDTTHKDRLTAVNGVAVSYNAEGFPLSYNGKTYRWANERLAGYSSGSVAAGLENQSYVYNASGQRISKSYTFTPGRQVPADYLETQSVTYTYDESGRLVNLHQADIYHASASDSCNMTFLYGANGVSGCVYTYGSLSTTYYFLKNLMGDITEICDSAGTVLARYRYNAYGACTVTELGSTNGFAQKNPFRYRGYIYDTDTGFYYCNARYYNPQFGRWISPDSIKSLDPQGINGLNLYTYANNNPVGIAYSSSSVSENSTSRMVSSLALGGAANGGSYLSGSTGFSLKFPSQNWLSLGIDFTAGMSGALSVLRWTSKNPEFYEFWYSAYGISKYEMLSNLKSPMTKIASAISYGLVAYETYMDVMGHINAGDSWQKTTASGVVTAGAGALNVWASAQAGAAVGAGIGGVAGFVIGTASGVIVGIVINGIFYTEINGNSIAGHIENGIEWLLEWVS